MRIRWTSDAVYDLEQIPLYILTDNPSAARNVIKVITDGIETLKAFPNRGRGGQVAGTREMVFRLFHTLLFIG